MGTRAQRTTPQPTISPVRILLLLAKHVHKTKDRRPLSYLSIPIRPLSPLRLAPMAPTLYPRGTVKKIVKAHSNRQVSKNVDILIYLNYALFMQELINEASIKSKQRGEKGVSARSVNRVSEDVLR